MKTCTGCGTSKALGDYSGHGTTRDRLNPQCRQCIRDRNKQWRLDNPDRARLKQLKTHLRNAYGITIEEYDKLVEAQEGLCAICGLPETVKNGRLAVDHDHKTGQIRGLLCFGCNTGIGKLQDDPALLRRAVQYLEESSVS